MREESELLENKEWAYSLYKKGERYSLSIPMAEPAPGFDVIHELTPEEIEAYGTQGMEALSGRLADMQNNPKAYHLQSWR